MVSSSNRNFNTESLEGKRIIITGGTTGIGKAAARLLASDGARVLIFGRHQQELNDALQEIGNNAVGLTADASKKQDVERIFNMADEELGGIDILINNAAVSGGEYLKTNYDDWRYTLDTNILGYVACARAAIDRMKRDKIKAAHIVNVGSMSADLREAGSPIYVATKAAIQGFTESLRKLLNPDGIRVSLIEPGAVATPMQEKSPSEEREKIEKMEMLE